LEQVIRSATGGIGIEPSVFCIFETHLSFVTLGEEYTDRILYAKSGFLVAVASA
jgi:hypothetical protein